MTRLSRIPASVFIGAVGSVAASPRTAGKVGAACNGANDDATCDSSPGAGDGDCDACRITGGESTQNGCSCALRRAISRPSVPGANPPTTLRRRRRRDEPRQNNRSLSTVPPHFQGCVAPGRGITTRPVSRPAMQEVAEAAAVIDAGQVDSVRAPRFEPAPVVRRRLIDLRASARPPLETSGARRDNAAVADRRKKA